MNLYEHTIIARQDVSPSQLKQIQEQVKVRIMEMQKEMEVQLLEQQNEMQEAVARGDMLPERFKLEMEKAQQMMQQQLKTAEQEYMSELQSQMSKIENAVVTEKEFKVMMKNPLFAKTLFT